jgi:hypothetical protein
VDRREAELLARTPNPDEFDVLRVEAIQGHLVMEVQYTSCPKCAFDAKKIMVFENVKLEDAIPWRHIDPHFAKKNKPKTRKQAPSPRARFPGDEEGWHDAVEYAKRKSTPA